MSRHVRVRKFSSKTMVALFGAIPLLLLTVACGDDTDSTEAADNAQVEAPTTRPTTAERVAGCEEANLDTSHISQDRPVARCEPGSPAPQPLAEPATIRLATSSLQVFWGPLLLAQELGEFEKENLTVELIVPLRLDDAMTQVPSGRLDVLLASVEAAFFNAVHEGIDLTWTLASFYSENAWDPSKPQAGLWARRDVFSNPSEPDLAELRGKDLASAAGPGSSIAYPINAALGEAGVSMSDMNVVTLPHSEIFQALENGAVDAAWMNDPFWTAAVDDPDLVFLAALPAGEPIAGYFMVPRLLNEDREVGKAFARALIRATNTYLDGDYMARDDVMEAMSEISGIDVEVLRSSPPLVYDWTIRDGSTDRLQDTFLKAPGVLQYDVAIPEDQVVNRSLYMDVIQGR